MDLITDSGVYKSEGADSNLGGNWGPLTKRKGETDEWLKRANVDYKCISLESIFLLLVSPWCLLILLTDWLI